MPDGARYFNGMIDDVHLYNRALTQAEVNILYAGGQVDSGLVGAWLFEETWTPPSLTCYDTHQWTPNGKYGNAVNFNGIDNYVRVTPIIGDFRSFAVLVWCKSLVATNWNSHGWIASYRDVNGFIIHPNGGTNTIGFYIVDSAGTFHGLSNPSISDITLWHQYGIMYDFTAKIAYYIIDGVRTALSLDITRTVTNIAMDIGRDWNDPSRHGLALEDEVQLFDRYLTADEIAWLYANGPGFPLQVADSGAGTDTVDLTTAIPASESGTGSDAVAIQANISAADSGHGTELCQIRQSAQKMNAIKIGHSDKKIKIAVSTNKIKIGVEKP